MLALQRYCATKRAAARPSALEAGKAGALAADVAAQL